MAREMKDSGIEWIGEIPKDWEVGKIKNICSLYVGNSIKDNEKQNYQDKVNAIPYISTKDININNAIINYENGMYTKIDDSNFKIAKKNSTLLCIEGGSAGKKISYLLQDVSFVNKLCCFEGKENVIKKYLYYFIKSESFKSEFKLNISGLIGGVSQNLLKNFSVIIPSLEEQEKIANYLDKKVTDIDLIIEKTKTTIEDYKKYKQSIITEAVTKGLNPNVKMKNSGIEWIGEIPKHWRIRKIKSFLSIISKGTTPKEISSNKSEKYKIKYIKSENISNGLVINTPEFYITSEVNEELKRSQLQEDILFVIAGAGIGKTAIMPLTLLPANTNQAVSFLRLQERYKGYKRYLWYFLQSNILKIYIELFSVQSAQPNLSMENLSNLKISLPEIFEIDNIVSYLDKKIAEIDNLIAKKESLINEMEEYKKSLIYECVTGKKEII